MLVCPRLTEAAKLGETHVDAKGAILFVNGDDERGEH